MAKEQGMVLKALRESLGLSRKEVAERSGINLRSLQDYEQGHKDIASAKAETLYRLSRVLGCSIDFLLTGNLQEKTVKKDSIKVDWFVKSGDGTIRIEHWDPSSIEAQSNRLYAYYTHIMNIEAIEIQKIVINSPQYKVEGRWVFELDGWKLAFWYEGKLVKLPFRLDPSKDMLPWMQEAAGLKIDAYVRSSKYKKLDMTAGGEMWDES